jgi:transposase
MASRDHGDRAPNACGRNRTYQDLATHYGKTVMPTQPRKPRDKAKVEAAVLIVERWILARLRNQRLWRS